MSAEWDQTKHVYIAIGDAVVEQDDKRLRVMKSWPIRPVIKRPRPNRCFCYRVGGLC